MKPIVQFLGRWRPIAIAAIAIVVPWLPIAIHAEPLALRVVLAAAAILAAFHGFGCVVAVLTRNTDEGAALRMVWGMAAYLALAGGVLALHRLDTGGVRALVIGGLVLHSLAIAIRTLLAGDARPAAEPEGWHWMLPAGLFAIIGVIQLFGAAGLTPGSWFDDDGHVLGQLTRLGQTGTLGDAVGYAREAQFGGQVVLDALAGLTGDLRTARMIDGGIGLALVLVVIWGCVRPRTAHAVVWTSMIGMMISGLRLTSTDPSAFWTAIALILGAYATLARPRLGLPWNEAARLMPVALLGAAVMTLRFELIPAGATLVIGSWLGVGREGYRRGAIIRSLVIVAAVVVPFAIARAIDRADVAPAVAAMMAHTSRRMVSVVRILGGLACVIALPLLLAGLRERRPGRPFVVLSVAVIATVGGMVSGALDGAAYGWRFLVPVVIAWALAVFVEVARNGPTELLVEAKPPADARFVIQRAGYAIALVAIGFAIMGARLGPRRWWLRYERMFDDGEQLLHVRGEPAPFGIENDLLARLAPGERVVVWVSHPERIDYTAHAVIDLRTRRVERLARHHDWWPDSPTGFEAWLGQLGVRYLLVAEDNARILRSAESWATRALCRPNDSVPGEDPYRSRLPICLDSLELVAATHQVVARDQGLRLVDLSQPEYVITLPP